MITQEAIEAAMRVYAALMGSDGTAEDADLFARQVAAASGELERGFEDLTAGILQIVAVLTQLIAEKQGIPKSQVVHAVGLALAPR